MGVITDVTSFLRTPKDMAKRIEENPKSLKREFIFGMIFLSMIYGFTFPILKMGMVEEALIYSAKDMLYFPLIFILTYVTLLLPLNLVLPDSDKTSTVLALWLGSILLIVISFIPLLFLSTNSMNSHRDVAGYNGLFVVLGTFIGAYKVNECLKELYNRKVLIIVILFTVLLLWTLLNVQNLFTLSQSGRVLAGGLFTATHKAAEMATVTSTVVG